MKIRLKFFEDNSLGAYGVSHCNTVNDDHNSFNAFWDGIGIFHDVFEHNFEYNHKYFQKDNALNIGGEMAAMGALHYYYYSMGLGDIRIKPNYYSVSENIRRSTESMILEAIEDEYISFGDILNCGVPYQKPLDDSELEYQLIKYWDNIKIAKPRSLSGEQYKKSITLGKIQNLHRWGYKYAQKLVPNNFENLNTLYNFIICWNTICKEYSAKDLIQEMKFLEFTLNKKDSIIDWKAHFITKNNIKIKYDEICTL